MAEMPINYHVVRPQPYDMEMNIRAHLLVEQPEEFDLHAILISMYDTAMDDQAHRFAVLHGPTLSLSDLRDHGDRDQVCAWQNVHCTAWIGWDPIPPDNPLQLQSGYGVTFMVQRLHAPPPDPHAWDDFSLSQQDEGELNLLQTSIHPLRRTLHLEDLLKDQDPIDRTSSRPGSLPQSLWTDAIGAPP